MSTHSLFGMAVAAVTASLLSPVPVFAWDYAGHRIVNQAALSALPSDFPAFVHEPAAAERVAFLAGEPDRWRTVPDLPIRHANGIDHYLDVEQVPAAGLDVATLPSFRYDFIAAFAAGRAAHPDRFPPVDPAKNADHSREWPGFAPWAIAEQYGKLRAAYSYLKAFEENGTPEEIRNARENVIYMMGVIGHYVADLAQPLHTTVHHNGWTGPNPNGYTTWQGFHQWIDGGFIAKYGITSADIGGKVTPAEMLPLEPRSDNRDPIFVAVLEYFMAQHAQVEPLYRLEKAGELGPNATDVSQGRAFIDHQLEAGAHMLSSLWLTAWRSAPTDTYLRNSLLKRKGIAVPASNEHH